MQYTEPIVKGKKYETMLPKGFSLVLEGGGMRGFYSGGVLDAFMEEGIMFPYFISVSAGAANSFSYISGQKGRNRVIVEKYISSYRYFGIRNLIFKGSLFDFKYIYETVPEKHIFFDKAMFDEIDVVLKIGAIDCSTGKTQWFSKDELNDSFTPAIASCSIPLISKAVKYKEYTLFDGGISDPIPIEKSIADGNTFHVIILTRNKGYLKKPIKQKGLLGFIYRKYPNLVSAILKRSEVYNRQLKLCEKLEKEGKAIIIRPKKKMEIDRFAKDVGKLLALYDEGVKEGKEAISDIKKKAKEMSEK